MNTCDYLMVCSHNSVQYFPFNNLNHTFLSHQSMFITPRIEIEYFCRTLFNLPAYTLSKLSVTSSTYRLFSKVFQEQKQPVQLNTPLCICAGNGRLPIEHQVGKHIWLLSTQSSPFLHFKLKFYYLNIQSHMHSYVVSMFKILLYPKV